MNSSNFALYAGHLQQECQLASVRRQLNLSEMTGTTILHVGLPQGTQTSKLCQSQSGHKGYGTKWKCSTCKNKTGCEIWNNSENCDFTVSLSNKLTLSTWTSFAILLFWVVPFAELNWKVASQIIVLTWSAPTCECAWGRWKKRVVLLVDIFGCTFKQCQCKECEKMTCEQFVATKQSVCQLIIAFSHGLNCGGCTNTSNNCKCVCDKSVQANNWWNNEIVDAFLRLSLIGPEWSISLGVFSHVLFVAGWSDERGSLPLDVITYFGDMDRSVKLSV